MYTVLLPTYNERENIALVVWLIARTFQQNGREYEIVVIDDNSPDGTQDVVKKLQGSFGKQHVVLVTRPSKLGLGSAYGEGLKKARGTFVFLMDADLSHHPKYLTDFIEMQEKTNCDVVSGSRYIRGGGIYGWDLKRKITSRGANILASTLLQPGVSDLTGAYRLFRKECLVQLISETKSKVIVDAWPLSEIVKLDCALKGYAFQMEIIVRARRHGFKLTEVPIVFVDRLYGESKLGNAEIVMYLRGLIRLFFTL